MMRESSVCEARQKIDSASASWRLSCRFQFLEFAKSGIPKFLTPKAHRTYIEASHPEHIYGFTTHATHATRRRNSVAINNAQRTHRKGARWRLHERTNSAQGGRTYQMHSALLLCGVHRCKARHLGLLADETVQRELDRAATLTDELEELSNQERAASRQRPWWAVRHGNGFREVTRPLALVVTQVSPAGRRVRRRASRR